MEDVNHVQSTAFLALLFQFLHLQFATNVLKDFYYQLSTVPVSPVAQAVLTVSV